MSREEGGGNEDQEKGKDGTKSRSKMWRTRLRKKKKKERKHNSQQINEDREQLDIWYTVYIHACVCLF